MPKYTSIILTYYNITFYSRAPLSHGSITGSQYPEPKGVIWKLVINHFIIYTCGFPTFPCQNVVKESCLWVTTRTWIGQFPVVNVVFYECEEVVMDGDCEKWSFQKEMLINFKKLSSCAMCYHALLALSLQVWMCVQHRPVSSSALIILDELSAHVTLAIALTEKDTATTNLHTAWVSASSSHLQGSISMYNFVIGQSVSSDHRPVLHSSTCTLKQVPKTLFWLCWGWWRWLLGIFSLMGKGHHIAYLCGIAASLSIIELSI